MNYDEHYLWAKDELRKTESKKRGIILGLAIRLEESGMLVESICAQISNNLSRDGYVTDRYVREVLEKTKYKRKYQNKLTEDIGINSELEQSKEQHVNPAYEISVSNTGEQTSTFRRKRDENLVSHSDFVGMERAILARDEAIKKLKEKYESLEKQAKAPNQKEVLSETEESERNMLLKQDLEGANMEIEFLKGQKGAEKIIALKGSKGDDAVGQFYWGKIGLRILKDKINELEGAGIGTVEIFMVSVGAVGR